MHFNLTIDDFSTDTEYGVAESLFSAQMAIKN